MCWQLIAWLFIQSITQQLSKQDFANTTLLVLMKSIFMETHTTFFKLEFSLIESTSALQTAEPAHLHVSTLTYSDLAAESNFENWLSFEMRV